MALNGSPITGEVLLMVQVFSMIQEKHSTNHKALTLESPRRGGLTKNLSSTNIKAPEIVQVLFAPSPADDNNNNGTFDSTIVASGNANILYAATNLPELESEKERTWHLHFNIHTRRLQHSSTDILDMMHISPDSHSSNPTWEAVCEHLLKLCTDSKLQARAENAISDLLTHIQQLVEGEISHAECAIVVPSLQQTPLLGRWLRVQLVYSGGYLLWLIDEPNCDDQPTMPQRVLRKSKVRSRKDKPWDSNVSHFVFTNGFV